MTAETKNLKNKKLKIDAPDGWIKLLNEYIEKNGSYINVEEAIRSIVRSYIVKKTMTKRKILTDYYEGYIRGYADAKKLDPNALIWKGFLMVTEK